MPMTHAIRHPHRRHDLRKDPLMTPDLLLRIAQERQSRLRDDRRLERLSRSTDSTLRRRLGESFIRLGERLARTPDPAWSR